MQLLTEHNTHIFCISSIYTFPPYLKNFYLFILLFFFSIFILLFLFSLARPSALLGLAPRGCNKWHLLKLYVYIIMDLRLPIRVFTRPWHGFPYRTNWVQAPHGKQDKQYNINIYPYGLLNFPQISYPPIFSVCTSCWYLLLVSLYYFPFRMLVS